jgi:hypothetical protein
VPLALLWLALSTHSGVPWIVPVLASVPFGTGTYFIFTSSFTYIVIAYRPVAATALACNTTMRTSFAAVFPLFAGQMYRALGTVGATLLLAGLTTAMAPLPCVYHLLYFAPQHHHHHPIPLVYTPNLHLLVCPVLCCMLWVLGSAKGNPVIVDIALLDARKWGKVIAGPRETSELRSWPG